MAARMVEQMEFEKALLMAGMMALKLVVVMVGRKES